MANPNLPFGFDPVKNFDGTPEHLNEYRIAGSYNTAIGFGQPVVLTSTGVGDRPTIQVGAGTNEIVLGTFRGCEYVPSTGLAKPTKSLFWPASQAIKSGTVVRAWVLDNPDQEYVVQGDSTVWAVTDFGLNADYVAGTVNTSTGRAGSYLNGTGKATTSSLMCRILRLATDPANTIGAYARLIVSFNVNARHGTTGN